MRVLCFLLFLFFVIAGNAQVLLTSQEPFIVPCNGSPFEQEPFFVGDTIKQRFNLLVDDALVKGSITYVLTGEVVVYHCDYRYCAKMLLITFDKDNYSVTKELESELNKKAGEQIGLTADGIKKKVLAIEDMRDWMFCEDVNQDGKLDLVIYWSDNYPGLFSNTPYSKTWVNLNGKLILWKSLAGRHVNATDLKRRSIEIVEWVRKGEGVSGPLNYYAVRSSYRVIKDTTLIKFENN